MWPNVTVRAARTAVPRTAPVSALIPDGTSTETTGFPDAFTVSIARARKPAIGAFKPVPNRASTTKADPETSRANRALLDGVSRLARPPVRVNRS